MKELYFLYEKLYFKSLEERDRILSKIQINMTIYIAYFAGIFYMLRMIDWNANKVSLAFYIILLCISLGFMLASIFSTYGALEEKTYYKIPNCEDILKFHTDFSKSEKKLSEFNLNSQKKIKNRDLLEELQNNLTLEMGECIDINNKNNEDKMDKVSSSIWSIKISILIFLLPVSIFCFSDLDVSSPRKNTFIEDRKQNEILEKIHGIIYQNHIMLSNQIVKSSQIMEENTDPEEIIYPVFPKKRPVPDIKDGNNIKKHDQKRQIIKEDKKDINDKVDGI